MVAGACNPLNILHVLMAPLALNRTRDLTPFHAPPPSFPRLPFVPQFRKSGQACLPPWVVRTGAFPALVDRGQTVFSHWYRAARVRAEAVANIRAAERAENKRRWMQGLPRLEPQVCVTVAVLVCACVPGCAVCACARLCSCVHVCACTCVCLCTCTCTCVCGDWGSRAVHTHAPSHALKPSHAHTL